MLCVSSDTGQYPNMRTYSTGQDCHIVDFPSVLELQELPNNMATNVS